MGSTGRGSVRADTVPSAWRRRNCRARAGVSSAVVTSQPAASSIDSFSPPGQLPIPREGAGVGVRERDVGARTRRSSPRAVSASRRALARRPIRRARARARVEGDASLGMCKLRERRVGSAGKQVGVDVHVRKRVRIGGRGPVAEVLPAHQPRLLVFAQRQAVLVGQCLAMLAGHVQRLHDQQPDARAVQRERDRGPCRAGTRA